MTRIVHIPIGRDGDPLWINLDNLTAVSGDANSERMALWFTGSEEPTLYLDGAHSAYFRQYLDLLAIPPLDPQPAGGISDADYFDHHTAAAAEGGSDAD